MSNLLGMCPLGRKNCPYANSYCSDCMKHEKAEQKRKMRDWKMKIKCGHTEFEVTEKDRILDNGAIYQLVTQYYRKGFEKYTPVVAKSTFDKLLKAGKIRLSSERWHGIYNCSLPLYEFVIGSEDK